MYLHLLSDKRSPGPPIIDIPPVDKYVLSEANVSFYCVGYGSPTPDVTWRKNGENVKETDRIKIDRSVGELRISSARDEDAGTYECIYSNKYGDDRKSAVLHVDGQTGVCKFCRIANCRETCQSQVSLSQII